MVQLLLYHSDMISFRRAKKLLRRLATHAFVAFFLLSTLISLISPAFAQVAPTQLRDLQNAATVDKKSNHQFTSAYATFFGSDATVTLGSWGTLSTQPQKASDVTFSLKATFNLSTSGDQSQPSWFWSRIVEEGSDKPVFLLRFCDVGDNGLPLEESCKFGQVPYRYQLEDESAISSLVSPVGDYDVINQTVSINDGVLPQLQEAMSGLLAKKIYRYGMRIIGSGNDAVYSEILTSGFALTYKPSEGGGVIVGNLDTKALVQGKRYQADVWACASDLAGVGIIGANADNAAFIGTPGTPNTIAAGGQNIRVFSGYRCADDDGGPSVTYFRVAGMQFTIPTIEQEASTISSGTQTISSTEANAAMTAGQSSGLPACAWFSWQNGTFLGCVAVGIYYVLYRPIAWVTGLFGQLFDFFLGYSMSDEAYRMPFAVQAWKLIRDIANIFFIVLLVYTGFATVFGSEKISMKKVVPALIINAIIINFSLVATRTVIDISNVATRIFYNTISVTNQNTGEELEVGGYKSVSAVLTSAFDPQKIFSAQVVSGEEISRTGVSEGGLDNDYKTAGFFIIISIIAALIMVATMSMFWTVAILFIGRTVGFYANMIFSPFAFLTRDLPFFDKLKNAQWKGWLADLGKNASLGPIFMLFLYVIVLFANSGVKTVLSGNSFFETVISIVVPMVLLLFFMKQAVSVAKNYAGEFGTMIQKNVEGAIGGGAGALVGAGLGVATGGAALLGRQVVGRGAKALSSIKTKDGSSLGQRWAANADNSRLSRFMNTANRRAQEGSWDVRNLGVKIGGKEYTAGSTLNQTAGALGLGLTDTVSKRIGISESAGKGGVIASDKKRAENRAERIKRRISYSHLSDKEAEQVWEKKKAAAIAKYGTEHWEEHMNENIDSTDAMKPFKERTDKAEQALKTAEEQLKAAEKKIQDLNNDPNAYNYEKQQAKQARDQLQQNKDRLKTDAENEKQNMGRARETVIKNVRDGHDEKTKAQLTEAAQKKEKDRLDEYGPIKNTKDLETAMRSEYARNLKERSFWGTEGTKGIAGLFATTLGGIIFPAVGAGLLANFGKEFADHFAGGIDDKALDSIIKEGSKLSKRSNVFNTWEKSLERYDKDLVELVNKHAGKSYKKYIEATFDEVEDAITDEIVELEAQINGLAANDHAGRRKREHRINELERLHNTRNSVSEKIDNWNKREEDKKDRQKTNSSDTTNKVKGK